MILMMSAAIAWVFFFVPESPTFLLEVQDFERFEECLCQIAKINGVKNYEKKIRDTVFKLKLEAEDDTSFNSNPS